MHASTEKISRESSSHVSSSDETTVKHGARKALTHIREAETTRQRLCPFQRNYIVTVRFSYNSSVRGIHKTFRNPSDTNITASQNFSPTQKESTFGRRTHNALKGFRKIVLSRGFFTCCHPKMTTRFLLMVSAVCAIQVQTTQSFLHHPFGTRTPLPRVEHHGRSSLSSPAVSSLREMGHDDDDGDAIGPYPHPEIHSEDFFGGGGDDDDDQAFEDIFSSQTLSPHVEQQRFDGIFSRQNLLSPASKYYKHLVDPFTTLDQCLLKKELLGMYKSIYNNADEDAKAMMLHMAVHSLEDDWEVVKLEHGEWRELFEMLQSSDAARERMRSIIGCGTVDSNSNTDWAPRVPFDDESGLSMWLKENHNNTSWNKNITSALDEEDPPVQLCQSGPYSYLAPLSLFLSYHHKFLSPESPWRYISMDEIRDHAYNQKTIYERVVHDRGAEAEIYLISEFFDMNDVETHKFRKCSGWSDATAIFNGIEKCGVGLIYAFRVEDDFRKKDKFVYSGTATFDDGDKQRRRGHGPEHVMVLIGVRFDADDRCWLLVQNSWKSKQFVTMTFDYFGSCGGHLIFMEGKGNMRDFFTWNGEGRFGEYPIDDGGDSTFGSDRSVFWSRHQLTEE